MTRMATTILTVLALFAFGGAAQAAHHEAGEDHGAKTEQGEHAECNHAADEPCPHVGEGKQCPHHEGKECNHTADEPCNHEHDHGKDKDA